MSNPPSQAEKRLVLCADGVPHTAIERLQAQGVFRRFHPPSRVISTFTSMTNVALKELFQAGSPAGYEAFYFDRERNRMAGGAGNYLGSREHSLNVRTYHRFVDYQEPVHFEFLVYVMPQRVFRSDLDRFLAAFHASDKPLFVGYLKSSDGLIHMGGQQKLDWAMRLLDDALMELMDAAGETLEITLFSDHGNHFVPGRRLPVKDYLRRWRYQVGGRLRSETGIVVPEFGLVGFAAIYTKSDPAPLARDLAQLEGVDFAVYKERGIVTLADRNGTAVISCDPAGKRFGYKPETSDPILLEPILQQLERDRLVDGEGRVDDRAWLNASADHIFPDAVTRVHRAMGDQVINRADILLSLTDDAYVGHSLFEGLVTLVATHGSARSECSTGFMMSTHRLFPPCFRASDAPTHLELPAQPQE